MLEAIKDFLTSEATRNVFVLLGILVAVISVWSNKVTARKKQTADFLFASRTDDKLIDGNKCLADLHTSPDKNMKTFASRDKLHTEECANIRYVLNHYERIAIGIQADIYDEEMLKKASYSTVVRLHLQAKPFIDGVRESEGVQMYYQEFEWLVHRWAASPLKKRKVKS
jgi:hypothetical protein